MKRRNISFNSAPGAGSNISAKEFFINNNPDGIVNATTFLDHFESLTTNGKLKYAYFWELLKNGNSINGMLVKRTDKSGIDYAWGEVQLVRGVAPFKIILLSDRMFDLMVKYQKAEVTIRFTLQELLDEAVSIEGSESTSQQSN